MTDFLTQWIEADRARSERIEAGLREGRRRAATLEAEVESPDGGVRVRIGSDKRLVELHLEEKVYQEYDEDTLAMAVMATYTAARQRLGRKRRDAINRALGMTEDI